ncbi:helix-turn-helix transcriptional regulator [Paenibacillus sp. SN-8-1]|uniref:helix-turn-helix transcriptional regulator n=1 Tax=Paenibacillus sp. SN-8-1 TaxID=3435409 RepID=UPI003D9A1549
MQNNVKFLRRSQEYDLTQEQLAEALKVSRSTVSHIERGGDISGSLLLKVAQFFEKDPREIFFVDDVG